MAPKAGTVVAFQGELGAFSHTAALKLLGERIQLLPCTRFDEVFQALRTDVATYAVIPIENTLHGSVHENYDHLLEYDVPIVAETSIRISHQLIAMPGTRFRDIRRAFSHPVAINQCLEFFSAHKLIEQAPFYDTAGSVKMLREQRPAGAAAIASATAAEIYGGVILRRNIEDDRRNFTRFFLLTKQKRKAHPSGGGAWKTSLVLSTPNRSGSLFKVTATFALRDLNLTKIESRPLRGKPWEYLFYIDLEGHAEDEALRNALRHLGEITNSLKVLGSYQTMP
jgi:prephenate dehydratase